MSSDRPLHAPDYVLLTIVGALVLFGLLMLASAGTAVGLDRFGDAHYFVKHQIVFGLVPGLAGLWIASRIPYAFWKRNALLMLGFSALLLVLVFIPGVAAGIGTAHSWVSVGGWFTFQPSEFVKLTFLLYLAAWLEKRGSEVRDAASGLIPFLLALGVVMGLLVAQPDVGTMSVVAVQAMAVYFVAGAPLTHIFGMLAAGVALLYGLVKAAPYRARRFTIFLNPELDPQGMGYHVNQALLAIGSGGLFGLGYGQSRQKFQFLPEVVNDSIFAVVGEELGFAGCLLLVGLFVALLHRIIRTAKAAPDPFGKYVCVGVGTWFLFQAFVNVGSMLSLMPMTGLPLPFISYGGSSLAISLAAVGVVLNISRYRKSV